MWLPVLIRINAATGRRGRPHGRSPVVQEGKQASIHVKGAPEAVLAFCADQRAAHGGTEPLDTNHWHRMVEELAADGQRVIAVAIRSVPRTT